MITVVRTIQAMPAKNVEVFTIAKELAAIIRRITGREIAVAARFGGSISEVAWISQYENLMAFEDLISKVTADADYRAVVRKLELVVVPGSGHDQVWRHV